MKVAFSDWMNRVSPFFDSAGHMLLFREVEQGHWEKERVNVESLTELQRVTLLKKWGLDLFICGGITPSLLKTVRNQNIKTIPFICGEIDEIFQALLRGEDLRRRFSMPGYVDKEEK